MDQRGEQTLNRYAKKSEGGTSFANNLEAVTKWTLNRGAQAKIMSELRTFAKISKAHSVYKDLRTAEILKSENIASKIYNLIRNDFINPFSPTLSVVKLYNLVSGIPIDDGKSEEMLLIKQTRLVSGTKFFHDPLRRTR